MVGQLICLEQNSVKNCDVLLYVDKVEMLCPPYCLLVVSTCLWIQQIRTYCSFWECCTPKFTLLTLKLHTGKHWSLQNTIPRLLLHTCEVWPLVMTPMEHNHNRCSLASTAHLWSVPANNYYFQFYFFLKAFHCSQHHQGIASHI